MMNRFFLSSVLIFLISLVSAQTYLPKNVEGKWGVIDLEGNWTVKPAYEFISNFNEFGLAKAIRSQKAGVINGEGKEVVSCEYDNLNVLKGQWVAAWKQGKCGVVSTVTGETVVPHQFTQVLYYKDSLFKTIIAGKIGLYHASGKEWHGAVLSKVEPHGKDYLIYSGNKVGVIHRSGTVVLPPSCESIQVIDTNIVAKTDQRYTWMVVNSHGETISFNEYPNKVGLDMAMKKALYAHAKEEIAKDDQLKKTEWIEKGGKYLLQNQVGVNLLQKEFDFVSVDEKTNLALAILFDREDNKNVYLVQTSTAKILAKPAVKDLALPDFRKSPFARVTIDTLWDGLVNKQGDVIETFQKGSEKYDPDIIGSFQDGAAMFSVKGKFGFVNTQAKVIVSPNYDVVGDFRKGYAVARKDGLFGIIRMNGSTAIPFRYSAISDYEEGVFRATIPVDGQQKWGVIGANGANILAFEYDLITPFKNKEANVKKGNKMGVVNKYGKLIIKPVLPVEEIGAFEKGIAWVGKGKNTELTQFGNNLTQFKYEGYIKRDGGVLIPPIYNKIVAFQAIWNKGQGITKVIKGDKIGFVNYKGQIVLEPTFQVIEGFEKAWELNEGLALVSLDGKKGYINHNASEVLPTEYDYIDTTFVSAYLEKDSAAWILAVKEGLGGYITITGEVKIPFAYHYLGDFQNDQAIVRTGEKWNLIDRTNHQMIEEVYQGIRGVADSVNIAYVAMKQQDYYVAINAAGEMALKDWKKELIEAPQTFEKFLYVLGHDIDGVAVVEKKGKQALLNKEGKLITKYIFQKVMPFNESTGLAVAQAYNKDPRNRKYGYINRKGEWAITPLYSNANEATSDIVIVKKGRFWGAIALSSSKEILPFEFEKIVPFSEGLTLVNDQDIYSDKGKKLGTTELSGKAIGSFHSNRLKIEDDKGFFFINEYGSVLSRSYFNDCSAYIGNYTAVQKGERWMLERTHNGRKISIPFSAGARKQYIAKNGLSFSQKQPDKSVVKDIGWTKVYEGDWKVLNWFGDLVYNTSFSMAIEHEGELYLKGSQVLVLLNGQGERLSEESFLDAVPVNDTIIKLISMKGISYFDVATMKFIANK